jgi:hypothetical protein
MESMYKLYSITHLGNGSFPIVITDGKDFVEACCEVKEIENEDMTIFKLINFHGEEFNKLCRKGLIDSKAIIKIVSYFYESFYAHPTYF